MRILIAEDDPMSCGLLERMLRKWVFEAVVCVYGHQALSQLQAESRADIANLD